MYAPLMTHFINVDTCIAIGRNTASASDMIGLEGKD